MKLTETITENYEDISQTGIDSLQVKKELSRIDSIIPLYEHWLEKTIFASVLIAINYTSAIKGLAKIKTQYTKEDITLFSLKLIDYESYPKFKESGIFLSALVNTHYLQEKIKNKTQAKTHDEKEELQKPYEIVTQHLNTQIDNLCYKTDGAVVCIKGSVGETVAYYMKSGTVIVEGSYGKHSGYSMRGGTLILKKKAESEIGFLMRGGTIVIKDNSDLVSQNIIAGNILIYKEKKEYFCSIKKTAWGEKPIINCRTEHAKQN